jgi:transcriptional regulator with XRE-family HTH domain
MKEKIFAIKLREKREEKGITQKELADILEKKKAFINDMEHGRSYPGHETLIKIADYFNVSLDYLCGRTDKPEMNK